MQYRNLPGTDCSVSLLAFGNFIFGTTWWGEFTDDDGVRLQNAAVDLGVNFFDTAPAYGNGRAESLLAKTIEYAGRDKLVISTKFGYDFYADPGEAGGHKERKQDFSGKFIRFDLEQSLKRMGIDRIDLYQAHNLKLRQFNDEMFETLDALKQEGKIKAWGVAVGPAIGWREEGIEGFERGATTVQTVMNLYEQDPGRELCEMASQESPASEVQSPKSNDPRNSGLGTSRGVIARVPTNSGILDEEFASADHVFPDWDHRKFRDRDWLIYGLKKNEIIRPIAEGLGLSIRELAIKWLASQAGIVTIEPNIVNEQDLRAYAKACDIQTRQGAALSKNVLDQLDALYADDFGLGEAAHPCDLKSSVAEGGKIRSGYEGAAAVR